MCSWDCICTIFLFTIVLFISILMQNNNEISNKILNESSSESSSESFYDSSNENEISNKTLNIHFVFMGDVSGSMKYSYDNNELQGK